MSPSHMAQRIAKLQLEVEAIQHSLATLLCWLPQSANAPLNGDEATKLLKILQRKTRSA